MSLSFNTFSDTHYLPKEETPHEGSSKLNNINSLTPPTT